MDGDDYGQRHREIAEGLRRLVADSGPEGVYDAELFCVLGIGEGAEPDHSDAWDVERLAALVNRPVCHYRNIYSSELEQGHAPIAYECSACGNQRLFQIPRFCPKCGREVVE